MEKISSKLASGGSGAAATQQVEAEGIGNVETVTAPSLHLPSGSPTGRPGYRFRRAAAARQGEAESIQNHESNSIPSRRSGMPWFAAPASSSAGHGDTLQTMRDVNGSFSGAQVARQLVQGEDIGEDISTAIIGRRCKSGMHFISRQAINEEGDEVRCGKPLFVPPKSSSAGNGDMLPTMSDEVRRSPGAQAAWQRRPQGVNAMSRRLRVEPVKNVHVSVQDGDRLVELSLREMTSYLQQLASDVNSEHSFTEDELTPIFEYLGKRPDETLRIEDIMSFVLGSEGKDTTENIQDQCRGTSEKQYDKEFAAVGGDEELQECRTLSLQLGDETAGVSRAWEQDGIFRGLPSHVLMSCAGAVHKTFAEGCRRIAGSFGHLDADAIVAPLKGPVRSSTKVNVKFGGDQCQLSDVLRATIRIKGKGQGMLKGAYQAMQQMIRSSPAGFEFVGFDDRFLHKLRGGYRDFLFHVRINGMTAELQVNFEGMLRVKENDGHHDYEDHRLNNDYMLSASQLNDASAVKQHLVRGADPNYVTLARFSALHYAALHNNADMAESLLEKKADMFQADSTGRMPVSRAVALDKFEVAQVILKHMEIRCDKSEDPLVVSQASKVDVLKTWFTLRQKMQVHKSASVEDKSKAEAAKSLDVPYEKVFGRLSGGRTAALKLAAKEDLVEALTILVQEGAEVNLPTDYQPWPLDFALASGATRAARFLAAHGGKSQQVKILAGPDVMFRCLDGEELNLEAMIARDMAPQLDALCESMEERRPHAEEEEEEEEPDPVYESMKELWLRDLPKKLPSAVACKSLGVVQLLLRRKASAEAIRAMDMGTFVQEAFRADKPQLIELLAAQDACFESCIQTASEAAESGNLSILKHLRNGGCPMDEPFGNLRMTPLHYAARSGHVDVVAFLAKCGSNLIRGCSFEFGDDRMNGTAAQLAAYAGHAVVLRQLADLSCDLDACNYNGLDENDKFFPVAYAAMVGGQTEIMTNAVQELTPQVKGNFVIRAINYGAPDLVRVLVDLKADLSWRHRSAGSALELASKNRRCSWAVPLLKELGAPEPTPISEAAALAPKELPAANVSKRMSGGW
eukprot:TRINITY_DN5943_c2_g1_i1.p1 TRINITY_DN5943_c2_g1~~TRINITY_DN5943_c2_g1_i1.p1  ORF type:complete len:1117 (+),score=221.72 TRINITY_DN5943_c2_g1_i1:107-3352(+)